MLKFGFFDFFSRFLPRFIFSISGGSDPFLCSTAAYRWFNKTVGQLKLRSPLTVSPQISCQEAIGMMQRENFDQIPVVDESGKTVLGVVTVANLTSNLLAGKVSGDSPVEKCLYKQFKQVIFLEFAYLLLRRV